MCPCIIPAVTQRFWPTAQHRPPPQSSLCLLALHILLSPILYSTLTKTQGPRRSAAPWDWSVGEGTPSHSDGLHKLFLRENMEGKAITLSHGSLLMFHIPSITILSHRRARRSARTYFQMKYDPVLVSTCFVMAEECSSVFEVSLTLRERFCSYLDPCKPDTNTGKKTGKVFLKGMISTFC